MAVYVWVVYAASLTIYPLGRDYALIANPEDAMSKLAQWTIEIEARLFGGAIWAHHFANVLLLYFCMLLLYRLTIRVTGGPWWLGTLAAALFMANPSHSEAVLNLTGAADIVTGFLALAFATSYVENALAPKPWKMVLACLAFAAVAFAEPENASLIFVVALFELLSPTRAPKPLQRLALPTFIAASACALNPGVFSFTTLDPAGMFTPLYLVFYPLGFLPETARAFAERPYLGWVSAAVVVFILFLIYRKARRPAMLFGLLAAASVRIFHGAEFVDPVHMIGGGKLLVANAFFNIALVTLFHRVMDHRKWRKPIVTLTTLLCVVMFSLEIRSVLTWRRAGDMVREFQRSAAEAAKSQGEPLAVLPDLRYWNGAPLCLSDSIACDTPFGPAVPAVALFETHYAKGASVVAGDLNGDFTMFLMADAPEDLLCYPYALSKTGAVRDGEAATVCVKEIQPKKMTFSVVRKDGGQAGVFIPEPLRWKKIHSDELPIPESSLGSK
jgi:hypothetical protein